MTEQMAIVTRAIDRMLEQHEPHPALVLDRYWNVIRTNDAAPRFFGSFVDLEKRPKPRNLLDLMFDPAGMRPFVEEWEKVAAGLLQRVRREAVGQVLDAKLQELLKRLREYPGVRRVEAVAGSSESCAADRVSARRAALLLLFLNHYRRHTAVHHGAGIAGGVHVSD